MELNVGEFIRTKKGNIGKVVYISNIANRKSYAIEWNKTKTYFISQIKDIKHSKNIIDLIEDEDIVILEYKTPRYQERITRKFEISKIEEYINFENKHCSFWCKVGDKKIVDNICKNIKIKAIVTKEQFKNVMYEV